MRLSVGELLVYDEDHTDVWHDVGQVGRQTLVQASNSLIPENTLGQAKKTSCWVVLVRFTAIPMN